MSTLFPPLPEPPRRALLEADLPEGEPWGWRLAALLLEAEDLARKLLTQGLSPGLAQVIEDELLALRQRLHVLRTSDRLASFGLRPPLPAEVAALEVLEQGDAQSLLHLYRQHGYGAFARHSAYLFGGRLEAVPNPDPVSFAALVGFERQIAALRTNVERFLEGQPALSTLLYGARGCGKSTAVKALRTAYAARGLRLVEVLYPGLDQLPALLEVLRPLPHKFLLYLDDLAFSAEDPGFHQLKALLEGAVYQRPANVLVVATSNRRNLINESWADRPDPDSTDPAAWDTLQNKLALADRFGLVLTFPPFDQQGFLRTVSYLLERDLDDATRQAALRFAQEGRGFSGRTARQFADWHR
ncbi:ATP-binding protein [Calidithermus chliarophilus]|uniref:ATP-binding protein n=1 Tax=Calidithermus chliarophilus TaxID=52023 RepID=UPI000418A3F1|nr:DUF815 domain-containing protein [Calidithermus chliarophilus]